jgi:hypothetical protein
MLIYIYKKRKTEDSNKINENTINENRNILTLESLEKYWKRKEKRDKLKKELNKELELRQKSTQTLGFDTESQKTLNLNEPIYIKNN